MPVDSCSRNEINPMLVRINPNQGWSMTGMLGGNRKHNTNICTYISHVKIYNMKKYNRRTINIKPIKINHKK